MGFVDIATGVLATVSEGVSRALLRVFGSRNERILRNMGPTVTHIGTLEPQMQALTDTELQGLTDTFRRRLADGETLDDLLPEAFAAAREAGRRTINMRHFDVQLMGGMVLHQGMIAEMVTGEGKTLVATLAAYVNALEGRGVHVVTVNDYLARRDSEWMGPIYRALGISVGAIQSSMEPNSRHPVYACDVTYGTNNEFGFDYLRDNMKWDKQEQVQSRGLNFAIVDEVDSILIDEARTPLIISGPAFDDTQKYYKADRISRHLKRDRHFEVKEKEHTCHMNEEGVREAEKLAGVESFYTAGNMAWPHLIDQSLRAHHLYRRDRDYMVRNGEVIIVDEFTGRLMEGRQWSDGLHQAVEAKERVRIKEENQTLATITLQNYFRMYKKIAGMTGTAMTEAGEFWKIYKLDVVAVPTNVPLRRTSFPDLIFCTEKEKYDALVQEIVEVCESGRPVLVGTTSIEKSERISNMIERQGVPHHVLNAKHHEHEAEIVAQAGGKASVTIATNMAGRGTDIILGGNAEGLAWNELRQQYPTRLDVSSEVWDPLYKQFQVPCDEQHKDVVAQGGLHIIGTERHEARRIDNQLRGRAGRQGDPGSSRFFLSLEDDLMRIFAGDWVRSMLQKLGMVEGQAIESRMVSRRIESAQRKVEERNFEIRKHLLEYDEVMDQQRKKVYGFRNSILEGADCKPVVLDMIRDQTNKAVDGYLSPTYGAGTAAAWATKAFGTEFEEKDFVDLSYNEAVQVCHDKASDQAAELIQDSIDENLSEDAESTDDWNWEALAEWAKSRFGSKLKARDLKRLGRDGLFDPLYEQAVAHITASDCAPIRRHMEPDWGAQCLAQWVLAKFDMEVEPSDFSLEEPDAAKDVLFQRAQTIYQQREIEFPVSVAMNRFLSESGTHGERYNHQGLVEWVNRRFGCELDVKEVHRKPRHSIYDMLLDISREFYRNGTIETEIEQKLARVPTTEDDTDAPPTEAELDDLVAWAESAFGLRVDRAQLDGQARDEVKRLIVQRVSDRFRPEMAQLERQLLLQIVDSSWKDHLYSMDRLKSGIGLRGYAQMDPKVEYKREGLALFEAMWDGVRDKVTNLIFRLRQMDEEMLGAVWTIGEMRHDESWGAGFVGGPEAEAGGPTDRVKPIVRDAARVGRNDPCPCGSGKKYKRCCMNKEQAPSV